MYLIQYINSALILFYMIKTIGYGVYTFKEKNVIGGISVMALAAGTAAMFVVSIIYILK